MYYITVRQKTRKGNPNKWLDLLNNDPTLSDLVSDGSAGTITRCVEEIPEEFLSKINVPAMINALKRFNEKHADLIAADKKTMYRHFEIPKKTGGKRPIDAPNETLSAAQKELKNLLIKKMGLMYHTASYAYVKRRSTYQNVRKHQAADNRWFLKTDFSGFFPSTNMDFTMRMLEMIFPASEICKDPVGREELKKALSLAFLNDTLPQGTPISPDLTNLIMTPIDYTLFKELTHRKFVYTRYADDIHISAKNHFRPEMVVGIIRKTLHDFGAPYYIKDEKTHYGSRAGQNWMLGIMLNKDNNMTVGWRNHETFRAMTANLIMDWKNGKFWNTDKLNHYAGLKSYYEMIEKDFVTRLVDRYDLKFGVDLDYILKDYANRSQWISWK